MARMPMPIDRSIGDLSISPGLSRLFQIISPSLPIGGYTYSQGIEWAVENQWIVTADDVREWLQGLMHTVMQQQELPILIHMLDAWKMQDMERLDQWNQWLMASRETRELRQEEKNRARAFCQILISLEPTAESHRDRLVQTQHACFSYACVCWQINVKQAVYGFLWGWLENLVMSAVKIIPLGQTDGQRILFELGEQIPSIIDHSLSVDEGNIGHSSMAMSIASSQHETQYTRLFRS